ncbi:uncharacterized protein [Nicotiana tomentosiformis]|uniref:uncharacterized protein n=1 Tax=Nicotiana tomentosiformis TaxID=4098 RepID=UPI00388CD231
MQYFPEDVPASQFKKLLRYWNSEKLQRMSKINIDNRKQLKNPHTAEKKGFALVCSKLENDKETSDPLSAKDDFVAIRKRKDGRSYKCSDEDKLVKLLKWGELKHNKTKMAMSP